MDLNKSVVARPSYYYSVGFFTILCCLPLLYTIKAPIYADVSALIKSTPLSSVLAASPGIILLGILIDQARIILKKYLFKLSNYKTGCISEQSKIELCQAISEILKLNIDQVNLKNDHHFKRAMLEKLPLFDYYTIPYRWINDFLENAVLVSIFIIFDTVVRAIGFSFEGIEFTVMLICFVIIIVGLVSGINLKKKYTLIETSLFIKEFRNPNITMSK